MFVFSLYVHLLLFDLLVIFLFFFTFLSVLRQHDSQQIVETHVCSGNSSVGICVFELAVWVPVVIMGSMFNLIKIIICWLPSKIGVRCKMMLFGDLNKDRQQSISVALFWSLNKLSNLQRNILKSPKNDHFHCTELHVLQVKYPELYLDWLQIQVPGARYF